MKILNKYFGLKYQFLIIFCFISAMSLFGQNYFKIEDSISLEIKPVYAFLDVIKPIQDGFIALIAEGSNGGKKSLIKLNEKGELVKIYSKQGEGPGEFRQIFNITVSNDRIYASEFYSPILHTFDHSLTFVKDFKLDYRGKVLASADKKIITFGIVQNKKGTNLLSIYNRNDLSFIKHAFYKNKDEVPAFVQYWGDLCKIPGGYAAIYSSEYQISLFDEEFCTEKKLINKMPRHIKKYKKWKKSPSIVDSKALDWMKSWSKMHKLFYYQGKYLLVYIEKDTYFDIIDSNGKILKTRLSFPKNCYMAFTDKHFVWLKKKLENEEGNKYVLLKCTLNLEKL